MSGIWAFLTQTLTVSLVALFLLVIKWLLQDKLSPRWQYAVWSLLAVRVLLPVPVSQYVLLPVPLWVEQWKTAAERFLDSAYTHSYRPVQISHVLPSFTGAPRSVTDWLFIVYAVGIGLCLLGYGLSYLRLRLLLRRGQRMDEAILKPVCQKYGLKSCPVVAVDGLETAFVCGVIRPVMAIPAQKVPDEKVLLHELLHKKYLDPLQSVLWCMVRCLHWCNPVLHFVCNRIENDMESLCDQRVLELLEGEERREYGTILLDMASRRYARAPGTGSISNGGRNISRRIHAIVRFKKYPQGMALVAVCILLVLLIPVLQGSAYAVETEIWPYSQQELEATLAVTRLNRCTTMAGAIDTYAKGLIRGNVVYIATASSMEMQETFAKTAPDHWAYDAGGEFDDVDNGAGYQVFGLQQSGEKYLAWLAYTLLAEGPEKHTLMVPIVVSREAGAWVVRETGQRQILELPREQLELENIDGPWVRTLEGQGSTGKVTVRRVVIHGVNNQMDSGYFFTMFSTFDTAIKTDAEFESVEYMDHTTYVCDQPDGPERKVGIRLEPMSSADEGVTLPETQTGTGGGGSSWGDHHQNLALKDDWDGILQTSNGSAWYGDGVQVELPRYYKVGIYFDDRLVEEFVISEVEA